MNKTLNSLIMTSLFFTLVLLSKSGLAQTAEAKPLIHHGHHGYEHQQMNPKKFARLTKKLALSQTQQDDIKALNQATYAEMEAVKPAMQSFRTQVQTLLSAETFDEQAFIALRESNQDVFNAMALIKIKRKFAMKNILTEEQFSELNKSKHKKLRKLLIK
jgi:protein CpxP